MLDFSTLTDDQLIELIRLAAAEAVERGQAIATAAKNAGLSEAEKARIDQEAYVAEVQLLRNMQAERVAELARRRAQEEVGRVQQEKEAAEVAKLWKLKGELGQRVVDLLGYGYQLTVWNRGADKRVYIDRVRTHSDQIGVKKVSYFHTGNSYNPPGTIDVDRFRIANAEVLSAAARARFDRFNEEGNEILRPLLEYACENWAALKDLDCDSAANYLESSYLGGRNND